MEIFLDGGLFELAGAVLFGYAINYIYRRKLLLLGYSLLALAAPVGMVFLNKGELFYALSFISLANGVLLVILLWRQRTDAVQKKALFDVKKYKQRVLQKFGNRRKKHTEPV